MIDAWISPGTLQKSIAPVTALVDEAVLRFEEGGMRIQTVDSANVGAISLDLLANAFHSYEANITKISLDLERLEEIVSKTSTQGNYLIKKEDDDNQITLSTKGYEFELALIQPDGVRTGPDPRELETPASIKLSVEQFSEAIRVASMFSEHLRMGIDSERDIFYMDAEGDVDDMHVTFDRQDVEFTDVAKAYGNYSLNYLEDIRKALPPDTTLTLGLGEELPLSIQYEIAGGDGRISYGLAPRI